MSYRPHPKGARVNPSNPRSWATCDRTGFISNQDKLAYQYDWAGSTLINKRILVRQRSLDKPQEQFRTIVIPPDPKPIYNARVEPYSIDESGPASTQLTQNAITGSTTLNVVATTGFSIGTVVYVYLDGGTFFLTSLTSVDPIGLTLGLANALSSQSSTNQIVCATASDV